MKVRDYANHDATALAGLISAGEISAQEVRVAALEAAEEVNPHINAMVEVWPDEALSGDGAFRGVPFVVKDIGLMVAGRKTEFGSRLAQGFRFDMDSDLMRRFRTGGLTPIGRTAIPEFATSVATEPLVGGPTCNPWNPAYSAGGSSGGAAAAVAAGIVPVAHATDGGGSIRVPASATGLVGLKPSRGRVAMGPAVDEIWGGLATQFVLTRSVSDAASVLDQLQGPNAGEPFEISAPAGPYSPPRPPGRLRIGLCQNPLNGARTTEPVLKVLAETAACLEELGHVVEPVTLQVGVSWEAFALATSRFWAVHTASAIEWIKGETGRPVNDSTLEPVNLALHSLGRSLGALDLVAADQTRNRIARHYARHFQQHDLLLSPTLPDLTGRLGTLHADVDHLDGLAWLVRVLNEAPFSGIANMTGTPAISLPLGHDEKSGLPIGMQFAGRFGAEDVLLSLASQLEQARPWAARRPIIYAGSA